MLNRVAHIDAKLADSDSLEFRVIEYLEDGCPRTIRQIVQFLNFTPDRACVTSREISQVAAALHGVGYILAKIKYVRWWQVWRWHHNHYAASCVLRISPELQTKFPGANPNLHWPGS